MKNIVTVSTLVVLTIMACQPQEAENKMPPGLDLTLMDQTANPKDDFYQFTNGGWLDKTEIPADEGRWGGFPELREKTNENVLSIMEKAADNPKFEDGTDERKALDFFAVGMDSLLAENSGKKPLDRWFKKIDKISDVEGVKQLLPELHGNGYDPFHGVFVLAHLKDSKTNALYLGSGGLGLPNRDYYTKEDSTSVAIREKYVEHVGKMLSLALIEGDSRKMANDVMEIENQLALATLTPIEQRNIPALYNPMTLDDLQGISGEVDWVNYFGEIGVAEVDTIIVTEPKFMTEMSAVLASVPVENIKSYLRWNVINRAANFLDNEMVQTNFDFYGKVIRGTQEMRPRWERVMGSTNGVIGEAIGKVYVAEQFPPEAKTSAEEMVQNLIKAFDQRIRNLEWMSDESKEQALKKLNNLTVKIGYPDKWRDYSDLVVESTGESYSYFGNMENARRWRFDRDISEIGEPVDKEEWGMSPQTVNAYFNPLNNEIVFPAAILQPPFYNYQADAAVNYGGMGAVIGHEISHGFDDQGSRFDSDGNMINWWTDDDRTRFEERTAALVAQFDGYEPLDGVNVQGKLTLGENIGDLGGLNAAYDALQIHLAEKGRPENIDGFTPEQRFFLSWATVWRTKYRDETLRTQILTDPHSPGMIRAVGPLVNMDQFYQAFDIQEGDGLWKPEEERVRIW